jgi:hypothetical protein
MSTAVMRLFVAARESAWRALMFAAAGVAAAGLVHVATDYR